MDDRSLKRSLSQTELPNNPAATRRKLDMPLDTAPDDLDDATHAKLNEAVLKTMGDEPFIAFGLLTTIVQTSEGILDPKYGVNQNAKDLLEKYPELLEKLKKAWKVRSFNNIRKLEILRPRTSDGQASWQATRTLNHDFQLDHAYKTPFLGDGATKFIKTLHDHELDMRTGEALYYAKAVPIVQSSGTGKSRMLTEAGKLVFTLPICLRNPRAPGFPPCDEVVYSYFTALGQTDLSFTAHLGIAHFLAASHEIMLTRLKALYETGMDGPQLLAHWHNHMEVQRDGRQDFFEEVVNRARGGEGKNMGTSPCRNENNIDESMTNMEAFAGSIYKKYTSKATDDLVKFLTEIYPKGLVCITYFDEADEMGLLFWVLLRLLSKQHESTAMWYVFMATKSNISYFSPHMEKLSSLRLKSELLCLIAPYFALGFDQNMIVDGRVKKSITVGELQSLEHACKYGRPLWHALFPQAGDGVLHTAISKLTSAKPFDDQNTDHVLAVLSQRLCIDPVLTSSEAIKLADRSVAHHMRLLTGFSSDLRVFYTYSPSEPVLVLGAVDILYNKAGRWGPILDTFSNRLCKAGLVEKGLIGELGARTLLLIARDFVAPKKERGGGRDLLKPVLLMGFLDQLFGNESWCGQHRADFNKAFCNGNVNFTHWIVTKDPLPEVPDQQLLANLYARGGALQCSLNQESLDLLIPVYTGSVTANAIFDAAAFSAAVIQVKYKTKGNTKAGNALRPIGIPRDLRRPLPYLAILLELGNESMHQETRSHIKTTVSAPTGDGEFQKLTNNWLDAVKDLEQYQKRESDGKEINKKKATIEKERLSMDFYNRYAIFVRGTSPDVFGILKEAEITKQFATLLKVTLPSPNIQNTTIQHMRPLERLGLMSGHTAWMPVYVKKEDDDTERSEMETQ